MLVTVYERTKRCLPRLIFLIFCYRRKLNISSEKIFKLSCFQGLRYSLVIDRQQCLSNNVPILSLVYGTLERQLSSQMSQHCIVYEQNHVQHLFVTSSTQHVVFTETLKQSREYNSRSYYYETYISIGQPWVASFEVRTKEEVFVN